jgi:hypothetical protein
MYRVDETATSKDVDIGALKFQYHGKEKEN